MKKRYRNKLVFSEKALQERVKELTCLYEMSEFSQKENLTLSELLSYFVRLIPPAWQYPYLTVARIKFNKKSYTSRGFKETSFRLIEKINVNRKERGTIEVYYLKKMPYVDDGPFLKEERKLLQVISRKVAIDIERIEAKEKIKIFQEQIRHADRLATIGELAAGVAHEINNPLNSILGFAQLINKNNNLNEQDKNDVERIIKASLHSREIIKKLMYFTRQMPQDFTMVNLNQVIRDAMYFLEPQCKKEKVTVSYNLDDNLPLIFADNLQLNQVIVNIVVNAIQAMQKKRKLTIATHSNLQSVFLGIEDTGVGMSEEIMRHIFNPFFTTKITGKGTGLGLSVVHGIVTNHKGKINVKSKEGIGTKFEIEFPVKTN
ncbi:MAG: ATP-binding protein [Bacteroidales bacterium]|nr:ATP-binding protein [Bacteroidales bacterium]